MGHRGCAYLPPTNFLEQRQSLVEVWQPRGQEEEQDEEVHRPYEYQAHQGVAQGQGGADGVGV